MKNQKLLIPKKIHQIWLGPKPRPVEIMDSWKKFHPDWEYKCWSEEDLFPLYNQKQYDTIKTYSGKADILRVEILQRFGGIYIDADCECINRLDNKLLTYPFFACYENEKAYPSLIANTVIGSIPGHGILAGMVQAISQIEDLNSEGPWLVVGPFLFTKIIRYYDVFHGPIKILPSYKFLPVHYSGESYFGKGKIYAIHYWNSTRRGHPTIDSEFFKS